jgi:hypothetical protein
MPNPEDSHMAGVFLAACIGLAVPVLGLGIATQLLSARIAVLGFSAVLLAVVAPAEKPESAARPRRCHPVRGRPTAAGPRPMPPSDLLSWRLP